MPLISCEYTSCVFVVANWARSICSALNDMQASRRIVVKDASKSPPFAQLIGREMIGVRVLLDEFNVQFGVRLVFGGASLLLYNWCDELYASRTPPEYPEWTHVRDVPLATLP